MFDIRDAIQKMQLEFDHSLRPFFCFTLEAPNRLANGLAGLLTTLHERELSGNMSKARE